MREKGCQKGESVMFNRWVELALFHDTALFSQAVSKLEAAGIPYKGPVHRPQR